MPNRSHLLLILFFLPISSASFGQDVVEANEPVRKETHYIHGLTMAKNDSLIAYGVASFAVVVMDRAYKQVARFHLTRMWGGGGACFSYDSKHLAYYSYGKTDTLTLYNLKNKKKAKYEIDNIEDIRFYNLSNQLLLLDKKAVSIFSLDKRKIAKTKKFDQYIDDIILSDDDQTAYVLFSEGRLVSYNTKNWKEIEEIASFGETVSNLVITESHLISNADGKVIVIDRSNREKKTFISEFSYICDIEVEQSLVLVAGRSPYLFSIYLDQGKTQKNSLNVTDVGIFSLLSMRKDGLLVGDGNSIYLVR